MDGLFRVLRGQIENNAQLAVDMYTREVAEYRSMPSLAVDPIGMFDFAVFIRRRTLDLVPDGQPLTDDDLSTFASAGRQRGEAALSLASQQQVVSLNTGLLLREVRDAAGPDDVSRLLRLIGWLSAEGERARAAYLNGFVDGLDQSRALPTRTELLARALVADEPVRPFLVDGLGVRVSGRYAVSVVRAPAASARQRAEVMAALATGKLLAVWLAPDELVVLTPANDNGGGRRVLDDLRLAVAAVGGPCQVGSAEGLVGRLAGSLQLAREISLVAPVEVRPSRPYAMADLFVELAVAASPRIDAWLDGFAERLARGPSLMATLSVFYANDMRRLTTASALIIHPRTLDYRLQRVREVTGFDPASTAGVRVLSAVVTRAGARRDCAVSPKPADNS